MFDTNVLISVDKSTISSFKDVPAINILRPKQNSRHFAYDFFKMIFLNENCCILIDVSLKFVPKAGIIVWMRPANGRRRYDVTSSLTGWAHSQNDPCQGSNWRQYAIIGLNNDPIYWRIYVTRPRSVNTYGDSIFVQVLSYSNCVLLSSY